MKRREFLKVSAAGAAAAAVASPAIAQSSPEGPRRPSVETLRSIIETETPQVRVEAIDHDRISARRIDIVDEDGVIRMTLSSDTPAPIIDGIQYRRAFGVSGLILYDENGSERGGFGVADVDGGMAVLALDHPAMDAIGWRVSPDGSVAFSINSVRSDRPNDSTPALATVWSRAWRPRRGSSCRWPPTGRPP